MATRCREAEKILGVKTGWSLLPGSFSDLRIGHGHHRNQTMIRLSITGREFRREQEKSLSFTGGLFS